MSYDFTREESIFAGAMEWSDPAACAAYLSGACGDDTALRQRIEERLKAHTEAADSRETVGDSTTPPAEGEIVPNPAVFVITAQAGDRIGRYKLLQKLGEGGCGVVYMAEQEEPVRR